MKRFSAVPAGLQVRIWELYLKQNLSAHLLQTGDCINTVTHYKKLIERYPKARLIPEAWYPLGICHEKTGNKKESEQAHRKVIKEFPDTVYGKQAAEKIGESVKGK